LRRFHIDHTEHDPRQVAEQLDALAEHVEEADRARCDQVAAARDKGATVSRSHGRRTRPPRPRRPDAEQYWSVDDALRLHARLIRWCCAADAGPQPWSQSAGRAASPARRRPSLLTSANQQLRGCWCAKWPILRASHSRDRDQGGDGFAGVAGGYLQAMPPVAAAAAGQVG
jgi:hypothetical protein